ncbi:hypothetical protein N9W89_10090 [Hellea sp.]|nr:hypothetical protein [Hellea sp.]
MSTHTLKIPLFLTRISIFYFMLPWQIMRFTKPESIGNISNKYYKFAMPEIGSTITGVLMIALLVAFVIGFKKKISYLLVLILHGIGTLMTIPHLIPGIEGYNQLFLAAIPTVMAMLLLYRLRNEDTLLSVG